jgi:hypothetical protein
MRRDFNHYIKTIACIFFIVCAVQSHAQIDSILSRIDVDLDFRFRIEQDWNSRKSDGTFRDNRSRLRYRLRTGMTYSKDWYSFGYRIRTGDPRKQQDPQLTLGTAFEEFGTLPLGFEKVFFKGEHKDFTYWIGKNDFSFRKNNELFWSDNVFPEGVFLSKKFGLKSGVLNALSLSAGHYILSASGRAFSDDSYVQGLQAQMNFGNNRFILFPSFYRMKNIPNIPDGAAFFDMDYNIFHVGGQWNLWKEQKVFLEFDFYQNVENYDENEFIDNLFKDEKQGFVFAVQKGKIKEKNDYLFKVTYGYLERFSALDYLAQNDWARWDYSSFDSPDGRLTNYQGVEIVGAYAVTSNAKLVMKYYLVNQLIAFGPSRETGSRIRLDLDVKF